MAHFYKEDVATYCRGSSLILEESYYYVKPTSVFCNACVGTSVLVMYLLQSKKRKKESAPLILWEVHHHQYMYLWQK